MSKFP